MKIPSWLKRIFLGIFFGAVVGVLAAAYGVPGISTLGMYTVVGGSSLIGLFLGAVFGLDTTSTQTGSHGSEEE